jgi:5,10-methylene-tetrahydrofolate dehydrogenase/methenyl tetrahydrofolate cyclohydrolase
MKGKTAAVVGRSNIVGLPVALLLQNEDATVTMVHSRTPNAGGVGWWQPRSVSALDCV